MVSSYNIRQKRIFNICLVFIFFLFVVTEVYLYNRYDIYNYVVGRRVDLPSNVTFTFKPVALCRSSNSSCDKWIVVTSIFSPTHDVKLLASLEGWNLVVVADKKTPTNWSLPGVHLLSIAYQNSIGFPFVKQLPYDAYTRKTIGYLYAIQQGAKFIYDTDDDNQPFGEGLKLFDYTQVTSGLRFVPSPSDDVKQHTFNPYRFFGKPSIWPRGFPLAWIKDHNNGNESMEVCRKMKTSAVQQGLVHKDPDVDAIYRLINAVAKDGLTEHFNAFAPPITLDKGTFAPWNSQNTLFSYPAFFTLFLPTTVSFRTTDIWRSFFAQKLLHLIDETVAFYPPNAVQYRNSHDFLKDFISETDVYHKSGEIIEFIHGWTCHKNTIIACTLMLASEFRNRSFIGEHDVTMIRLWMDTLKQIGYEFPSMNNTSSMDIENETSSLYANCRKANLEFPTVQTIDSKKEIKNQIKQKLENFEDILRWCPESAKVSKTIPISANLAESHTSREEITHKMNSVAIITNNWPWKRSIEVLQRMYSAFFAVTVFCGTWNAENYTIDDEMEMLKPFNFIDLTEAEMHEGVYHYYCLSKVRDLKLQNINGYYLFSDDIVFNLWNKHNVSMVLHSSPLSSVSEAAKDLFWNTFVGQIAMNETIKLIEAKYKNDEQIQKSWMYYGEGLKTYGEDLSHKSPEEHLVMYTGKIESDFQYIPSHLIDYVSDMYEIMAEAGVFLEYAFNKILYTVPHEWKPSETLWENRDVWESYYNENVLTLHPVKLSTTNQTSERSKFCDNVIAAFHKNLFT